MSTQSATREPGYAIGTVAGLTGLDPHTIRAWERRYGAVSPRRGPRGVRRYDDAAVARLQLLKAVTDCGEAIGSIATLPDAALRERLGRLAGMAADGAVAPGRRPSTLALLAPGLSSQLDAGGSSLGGLRVAVSEADVAAFLEKLSDVAPEVVVAELPRLGREPLRRIEEIQDACDPQLLVLVYDFARGTELARLSRGGARLVRGPLRTTEMGQMIDDFLAIEATTPRRTIRPALTETAPGAPRLFSDEQIAKLMEWHSAVQCECPSHVATLVSSALAFERYSEDCESLGPEDAALHRYLAGASARVRHELETMLQRVCEHEDIPV